MNKIVYVEDDSEVGNLIAALLGKHDFEVIVEPRGDRALEMGANDYILKTTPPAVLLARVLHFSQLSIDAINRQVILDSHTVLLSTADFELLCELICHAGQIMDRKALLKKLRGVSYDGLACSG